MDADRSTVPGSPAPRVARPVRIIATAAFLAVAGGMVVAAQRPPAAAPADAPPDTFSAARAMKHVRSIASQPHPLGSAAAEPVVAYIRGELEALGLEVEVQRPRDARPRGPESAADPSRADVVNLVARWRGTGPPGKKALLLSAHHDSVRRGPGAGDDASGVAAILESLRALKHGPPPERDVIVLINDGEEVGLYGADVFAAEHRWADNVGAVLNFDARGNTGASFMFETSAGNGWLIEQMARALPHPMATSLTMEVYKRMPNDTDLTIYKRYGMAGWNFAFVGGLAYYHSAQDTPENLDPRTLQHQGENLLSLARRVVRLDLDNVRADDVVYCSVLQKWVAIYPMTWVIPLAVLATAAYCGVVALGVARRRIRLAEVAAGMATFLTAVPAAVLTVSLLWMVLHGPLIRSELVINRHDLGHGRGMPVSPYDVALLSGFSVAAIAVAGLVFGWSSRRWSWEGMGLGVLAWWLLVAWAASVWMPGASYAFIWPLLAILAGQALTFFLPEGGIRAIIVSWLGALPLLVVQLTIIEGVFNGLNLRLAHLLMIPVVLVAAALLPVVAQALDSPGTRGKTANDPINSSG